MAEARSAEEPVLSRRCVVMKVSDFTTAKYLEAQKQNAAAILVLVPRNMSSVPQDTVQVTCIYLLIFFIKWKIKSMLYYMVVSE